jgi:DNA-binding Xre family transcriptional regulator
MLGCQAGFLSPFSPGSPFLERKGQPLGCDLPYKWYILPYEWLPHGAWSNLKLILAQRNLSVLDLHKKLQKRGVAVNVKSLYRLAEPEPLWKIDTRIVNAICQTFGLQLGDLIQLEKPTKQLQRMDAEKQERLEALMEKNNEGEPTRAERAELTRLVEESQRISLHNARVLVEQKRENTRKKDDKKRAALID